MKKRDIENAISNPSFINWSKETVGSTFEFFDCTIEHAKNGEIKDMIDLYAFIKNNGGEHLLVGNRLAGIYKAEYFMKIGMTEQKAAQKSFMDNFGALLRLNAKEKSTRELVVSSLLEASRNGRLEEAMSVCATIADSKRFRRNRFLLKSDVDSILASGDINAYTKETKRNIEEDYQFALKKVSR